MPVEAAIADDWRRVLGEQNDNVDVLKQTLATPIGSLSPVTPPHEVVGLWLEELRRRGASTSRGRSR